MLCAIPVLLCVVPGHFDIRPGDELRSRTLFIESDPGKEKGQAALMLVRESANDGRGLIGDEDTGIAFVGAWHRTLRRVYRGSPAFDDGNMSSTKLPFSATQGFVGFIEGRCGLSPPTIWSDCFRNGSVNSNGRITFPVARFLASHRAAVHGLNDETSYSPTVFLLLDEDAPAQVSIESGGEPNAGRSHGMRVSAAVKQQLLTSLKASHLTSVPGISDGSRIVLFVSGETAIDHRSAICISESGTQLDQQVLWKTKCDVRWFDREIGLILPTITECRLKGDLLYLFHCTESSIGVECMRIDNGERRFSFNSWSVREQMLR